MQSSSTPTDELQGSLSQDQEGTSLLGEDLLHTDNDDEETQIQLVTSSQSQSDHDERSRLLSIDRMSSAGASSSDGREGFVSAHFSNGAESGTDTIRMSNRKVVDSNNKSNVSDYGYGSISTSNGGSAHANNTMDMTISKSLPHSRSQSPMSSIDSSIGVDSHSYEYRITQKRSFERDTMEALKNGGTKIVKDENRYLSFVLFGVILICTFCMAILATANGNSRLYPNGNGGHDDHGYPDEDTMTYFPNSNGTTFNFKGTPAQQTSEYVPFLTIDRGDDSVPASEIVFPELFHTSLQYRSNGTEAENVTKPFLNVPFPTGAFWSNLVIQPTADHNFSYPIMSYPYGFKWNPSMMQVSYPPLRRLTDNISIRDIFNPDLTMGSEEKIKKRNIVRWDSLSVTLRFYGDDNADKEYDTEPEPETPYWESYLVQGQPYITAKYNKMTPKFNPLTTFRNFACPRDVNGKYKDDASDPSARNDTNHFGVCSVQASVSEAVTLHGVQFLIETGDNLTWMLFASTPITLIFDNLSKRTIFSNEKYSGVLRFALLPPPLHEDGGTVKKENGQYERFPLSTSMGVKRLIYHAHTYPIGVKLSWNFQDIQTSPSYQLLNGNSNNIVNNQDVMKGITVGSVKFEFVTKSMQNDLDSRTSQTASKESLLMLALPHHAQVLPFNMILKDLDLDYQSIKGTMSPVIGSKWVYDEHLTNIGFDDQRGLKRLKNLDLEVKKFILNQVDNDLRIVIPSLGENVYGFGKEIARVAQLGHIASVLESGQTFDNVNETSTDLTNIAMDLLYEKLTKFLDGNNRDNLLFDINFGGIISQDGLSNRQADFGNGWYNDHHFHYGYFLYAAAILGRHNSTFVEQYGLHVDSLMYDVAHGANTHSEASGGAFFPFTRHKSWFDGHSFASGLFPFGDGKSQESTSEAVNCYYGAYLWSLVRWKDMDGGLERINFSKLLLAMEIRGAKTYWHMLPPKDASGMDSIHSRSLYNDAFSESLMVGNLGMSDVTVSTWFGSDALYVHMINFMPVTAATKELFDPAYIQKEFQTILKPIYNDVPMAWRGYVISDRAMSEPNQAWNDATKLISYELDSALSQSQVYYWIASMENFNSSSINMTQTTKSRDKNAWCDRNDGCSQLGLVGLCCPTQEGLYLGCC